MWELNVGKVSGPKPSNNQYASRVPATEGYERFPRCSCVLIHYRYRVAVATAWQLAWFSLPAGPTASDSERPYTAPYTLQLPTRLKRWLPAPMHMPRACARCRPYPLNSERSSRKASLSKSHSKRVPASRLKSSSLFEQIWDVTHTSAK